MVSITEYVSGEYKANDWIINPSVHVKWVNGDRVGIYDNGLNHYIIPPTIFSEWTDPSDTPYASLQDLINDLNAFFFDLDPASLYTEVNTFADLPDPALNAGVTYHVINATGLWILGTRRQSGLYRSNGTEWILRNDISSLLVDSEFNIRDDVDNSKGIKFELQDIGTGQIRTVNFGDRDIDLGQSVNTLKVGTSGFVDFATIEDAIAYINTQVPSSSNQFSIELGAEDYNVNNPLVMPEFVAIIGKGPRTRITPQNPADDLLQLQNSNSLRSLALTGVNGANSWLINCNSAAGGIYSFDDILLSSAPFSTSNGINAESSAGIATVTFVAGLSIFASGTVVRCGENATMTVQGLQIIGNGALGPATTKAVQVESSGNFNGFAIIEDQCDIGLETTGTGFVKLTNFEERGVNVSINQLAQTPIEIQGGNLDFRIAQFTNKALFQGYALNNLETETQLDVFSELAVGTQVQGRESVFGEGDSTSDNLLAFTQNAAENNLIDVSNTWKFNSGTTATFQNNAIGEIIYIGSDAIDSLGNPIKFMGLKFSLTQSISEVIQVVDFQYWNGATWVSFNYLITDANSPYLPFAKVAFGRNDEQCRFDIMIQNDWVINDPVGLGRDRFWVRIELTQAVAQLPLIDQVKNHTNRSEFNADGFLEYFGNARPIDSIGFDVNNFQGANNSPANQDVYLSDVLGVGRIENEFQDGATDRSALVKFLPFSVDTSSGIFLKVSFRTDDNSGGNITFNIYWAISEDGDGVFGTTGGAPPIAPGQQTISITIPAPAQDIQETFEATLDISEAISRTAPSNRGNLLWISIERVGGADSHTGDVSIIQLDAFYFKWTEGGHTLLS